MFILKKEAFGKFTKINLFNKNTKEYVSIIPEFGANVNQIVLKKKKLFSILDCDKNYKELLKNKWFKGAKLIPFPNRINDGKYFFDKKHYELPVNFSVQNHAIHGLLYNKRFKINKIEKNKKYIKLELIYLYNKEFLGYPFDFEVKIEYSLSENGFKCNTLIKNKDKVNIPVGDGWHPYFTLNKRIDDLFLKTPSKIKVDVNNRMIPVGKSFFDKFFKLTKISEQKFDTGFVINSNNVPCTELYEQKSDVKIVVWQETGKNKYNFLQIFIPPSRKSIAIEPMTCNTNAFNNKQGLIILKPNQSFKASYGVYLE